MNFRDFDELARKRRGDIRDFDDSERARRGALDRVRARRGNLRDVKRDNPRDFDEASRLQ